MTARHALVALALLAGSGLAACDGTRDGSAGNPPSTATQRAYDRATQSNVSGAYPQKR